MNINELFIYLEGKIYKIYLDENNKLKIRLKKPEEETTNKICLLLHTNKNMRKSGYIVVNKDQNINEDEILNEASRNLNSVDATTVYLLKTSVDNYNVYYYTSKYEIERLFLDLEFKEIYPLEFFLYNIDTTGELYGIVSEDLCYIRKINSLKNLQEDKPQILIEKEEPVPLSVIVSNLSVAKHKYMLINNNIDFLINLHDTYNKNKIGNSYIPFKERKNNEEIIDPIPLAVNLKELKFEQLLNVLKEHSNFKFEDKVSTFYKAKKLKPLLIALSMMFISLSIYFVYQFINTQTINYIYNNKIKELKTEIKKLEKKKKEAKKNNLIPYYKPLNVNLLNEIKGIISSLNIEDIKNYSFSMDNKSAIITIITNNIDNAKKINDLQNANPKIQNIELKKRNDTYNIKFEYGDISKKKHRRLRR